MVSPWQPTKDTSELRHLGKLAEELNEAGAAAARCIIQGIGESEPVTGKPNKLWLEEELADVMANIDLVVVRFGLNYEAMLRRKSDKMAKLSRWHEL